MNDSLKHPIMHKYNKSEFFLCPSRNSTISTFSYFLRLHVFEEEGRGNEGKAVDSPPSQTVKWPFNITGLKKK